MAKKATQIRFNFEHEKSFSAHDNEGSVAGFYIAFDPIEVKTGLFRSDPATWKLVKHLENEPLPSKQRAIFLRR